ncbi:MAG: serine/threonine protein kinase [Lentisphaeria bacterium]|nr:serine/threonine protein kinase [Lentisphaeria bacterium]MBR7120359.1 serine/threonine protein kinase [Lentisphaeria bacterium]
MSQTDMPLKINCRECFSRYDVSDLEAFSTFPCPRCGAKLRVPKRFGHFLLEKLCGRGGMSHIYRAKNTESSERVALKILNSDCDDPDLKNGYSKIFDMVSKLSGRPGVVPVYEAGEIEGTHYLSMQYLSGGDVEHRMRAGKLPELRIVANWLADVGEGLEAAHSLGIVHHDIKPSNIFINSSGRALLGDFDLADYRSDGDISTPCHGWASPAYVSPERLYGGGEDFKGDIFSLGVTAYELLGGKLPFSINGEAFDLYEERRKMEFSELYDLAPELGRETSDLVRSMLDFDPNMRPDYPEAVAVFRMLEWV